MNEKDQKTGLHPSDHAGVWVRFDVKNTQGDIL